MPQTTDALIICTRNRDHQIKDRLKELLQFSTLPPVVVIVDSSDSIKTEEVIKQVSPQFPVPIMYLRSRPGLPHQRNVGVESARRNIPNLELIHFLDDDIIPGVDYFARIRQIFHDSAQIVAVGGYDSDLNTRQNAGLIRRIMGIGSKKCGVILRSGIAIPARPQKAIETCEWLVGGMQSVRAWVFDYMQFDATLRMYGEDLDFYLRVCDLGEIVSSINLPIKHLNDSSNRDSWREINLYHNGVRWLLAQRYPNRVAPIRVIQVAVILAFGEAAKFVWKRDWKHVAASVGNVEFLYRLLRSEPVVQVIEPV